MPVWVGGWAVPVYHGDAGDNANVSRDHASTEGIASQTTRWRSSSGEWCSPKNERGVRLLITSTDH